MSVNFIIYGRSPSTPYRAGMGLVLSLKFKVQSSETGNENRELGEPPSRRLGYGGLLVRPVRLMRQVGRHRASDLTVGSRVPRDHHLRSPIPVGRSRRERCPLRQHDLAPGRSSCGVLCFGPLLSFRRDCAIMLRTKSQRHAAPNVRKAVPKCVPPRLHS